MSEGGEGSFRGKSVLVTGGGAGIGREIALDLGRCGANVFVVDVDGDSAAETAEMVAAHGAQADSRLADVSDEAATEGYVSAATDRFGPISAFFANAGIEGSVSPITELDADAFDRIMAVNARGIFLGLKHVLPGMIGRNRGTVVVTASIASHVGFAGMAAYTASKHAVAGLVKAAAAETAPTEVRVNGFCPGFIDTGLMRRAAAAGTPVPLEAIPMGRYGQPSETAKIARFLASPDASYVHGALWMVDGGVFATP